MRAKIFIVIIILLLVLVRPAQAQEISCGPIWSYETDNAVWEVAISSDGNYIAAGSFDDTLYFFSREGKLLWKYKTDFIVKSVSISSDGNYIAAGRGSFSYITDEYAEGKLYLFNREGRLLWSYGVGEGIGVERVSISSDGNYIVAGVDCYPSNKLYFFNKNGKLLWSRENINPDDISISSDGSYVVAGCDGGVCFFNGDGKLIWSYDAGDGDGPYAVSVSSDGRYVTAGYNGKVYFFNRNGELLWSYKSPEQREGENYIYRTWISSDGNYVAATTCGKLYFFTKEGRLLWSYQTEGNPGSIWKGVSISSDGSYLVVGNYGDDNYYDGNLYFFTIEGELLWKCKTDTSVESASISSDGSYVAIGTDNKIYYFVGLIESENAIDETKPVIDGYLLNLIDEYADDNYNPNWNLSLNQYKAWIATIAWAEGGRGGYVAHSQKAFGRDVFYHRDKTVDKKFRFSTGIGPFQLDRGGYDEWGRWPTIDKLDPEKAVESALKFHDKKFAAGTDLEDFADNSPWYAVNPKHRGDPGGHWKAVTGTNWDSHKNYKSDLDWDSKKTQLAQNAKKDAAFRYENNMKLIGEGKWNITENEGIKTDTGNKVIFDGYYRTWLITSRNWGGTELFKYYYAHDSDEKIEVWVWDNSYDQANKFRYIFVRNYSTGALPEHADTNKGVAGKTLKSPAIIEETLPTQPLTLISTETPAFESIFAIAGLLVVAYLLRRRG